jgi:plastocyanin
MITAMRWLRIGLVLLLPLSASAADREVQVSSFQFQPAVLTITAGDTVIWRANEGGHNVVADDGSFGSGPPGVSPWTFSRVFPVAGTYRYYCAPHGGPGGLGMSGRIVVEPAGPPPFQINVGLSGAWFNPDTGGQGWFFDIAPAADQLFFAAWFTWDLAGGDHDWFTAQGRYEGDRAIVPLVRARGGRFDAGDPVTVEAAGEINIRFESCTRAEMHYRVDETGRTGVIPLFRLTPAPASCEQAQQATGDAH